MSKYATKQRKILLAYLGEHTDELLSAQHIAEDLREQSVSLSAIYRNLLDFEAEGLVRRRSKEAAREVFFQFAGAESCKGCVHLCCQVCGRTFHMECESADLFVGLIKRLEDFRVDKTHTVLYGVCDRCQN